jgi:hypothetical protein
VRAEPAGRRRWWLAAEFVALYFGVVGGYIALSLPGGPIPPLVVGAVVVAVLLRRDPTVDRRDLLRPEALRPALPGILTLWAAVSVAALAGVALADPGRLFDLPRDDPAMWAAVVIGYPFLSVYPQELLYRAFLLHRYAPVLGTGRRAAAAGAAAFGFAHLLFGNVLAVVATVVGGWLFTRRYQRTRSLLTVSVEHALYGVTIFTIGLGRLFYHGP